jgi:hypothetical protein
LHISSDSHYARKRIYQPKNSDRAVGVILVGYCPDTLAYFNAIFEEARWELSRGRSISWPNVGDWTIRSLVPVSPSG